MVSCVYFAVGRITILFVKLTIRWVGTIILLYWSHLPKSCFVCMDTLEVSEAK